MKKAVDIIDDILKRDIIDMIGHVKSIVSTEMTQDQVETVHIYVDTIAALVSNNPDYVPKEER